MIHNKILELFFEEPNRNFQIREISRITKIPVMTTKKYLEELKKEDLIIKEKKGIYPSFKANENKFFKFYKQQDILLKIYKSGLIDYLEKELHPKNIILFGSMKKGEYVKESDIDIFLESNSKKHTDLTKFEKILKHDIQLFIEENINKLQPHLFNNIINGTILSGYLKLK